MERKFFRYQYEYTQDGIIQSGCIWDSESGEKTTYLYMTGEYTPSSRGRQREEGRKRNLSEGDALDMFVLGAYTVSYIRRLVEILEEREIRTVILPYVPPGIRLEIAAHLDEEEKETGGMEEFLKAPYAYLKKRDVDHVYLLYGNGPILKGRIREMEEGHYFEKTDKRLQKMIANLEGEFVPVYSAGYIIENQWLYYFGFYNVDSFWSRLGLALDTITMFAGPLLVRNEEVNGLFMCKPHTREQCHNLREGNDCYENCLLKCIYRSDYDVLKRHMDKNHEILKTGILNLGNVNLKADLNSVIARYGAVLDQIRGISIPNCGNDQFWDKRLLSVFTGSDMEYYICACGKNTGSSAILDIAVSSAFNRFVNVNDEFAYCFSGYIVQKEEN